LPGGPKGVTSVDFFEFPFASHKGELLHVGAGFLWGILGHQQRVERLSRRVAMRTVEFFIIIWSGDGEVESADVTVS